jgi:superfamily II DNA or RNA helicase
MILLLLMKFIIFQHQLIDQLNYLNQKFLGLTATPERMDGENILEDFCNRIAAEIRLPEALNKNY